MTIGAPPATNVWPLPAMAAQAMAVLRLEAGDPDEIRVTHHVVASTQKIDDYLDGDQPITFDSIVQADLIDAAVEYALHLYRRKDAALGGSSVDGLPPMNADPFDKVRHMVLAHKRRWGVA